MEITDIKIRRTYRDNRLKALVSLTIDSEIAIHDIKVIEGPNRLFVAMPSRRDENGEFRDICHPITLEARKQLESVVLNTYHHHISTLDATQQDTGAESIVE